MKFKLVEDYKTADFIKNNFKKAVSKYIPSKAAADIMFKSKLKDITESEWRDIEDWINYLQFPLTIYRGLNLDSKEKVDLNNLGVNWTVDDTLFFEKSAFSNCNIILEAVITEDIIDWPETIQNYIYYSLRPNYGFYPEEEITLKKNYKPSQLKDLKVYTRKEFSEVA